MCERFPSVALKILDALSIFELEKNLLILRSMNSVYTLVMSWNCLLPFFYKYSEIQKTEFVDEWDNLKFELITMRKKNVYIKATFV